DSSAAGVARGGAARPAPAGGTGRLYGLRDVVPRRSDGRRRAAGARGGARSAGRGRARRREPRGRHAALARGRARLPRAAAAHHPEQLLHGHLAAVDERVRAFVLEGDGRAAERAQDAVRALEILGCETTLVPTVHPVVDVVRFQLLTVDLAEARGVDPDR